MKRLESGKLFCRYALGEVSMIALSDGYVDMPPSRLRQAGDRPFGENLPAQVSLVDGNLRLSVNAFLIIDRDGQHVLIDAGTADSWLPTMGSLLDALEEAKVPRERIETVALTHTHADHVNGLVASDGTDSFANLKRLFVPREELGLFDEIERVGRYRGLRLPVDDGLRLSESVVAVSAHGHEVGHTAYRVSSGEETLWLWGDLVHVQSLQFDQPEVTWEYDADQERARATRLKILQAVAQEEKAFVAGAHLDFPGVGKVERRGDGGLVFTGL